MSGTASATLFWGVLINAGLAAQAFNLDDFDQTVVSLKVDGYTLVCAGSEDITLYGFAIEESVRDRTEFNCERPIPSPEFDLAWPHKLMKGLDRFIPTSTGVSAPGWYLLPCAL